MATGIFYFFPLLSWWAGFKVKEVGVYCSFCFLLIAPSLPWQWGHLSEFAFSVFSIESLRSCPVVEHKRRILFIMGNTELLITRGMERAANYSRSRTSFFLNFSSNSNLRLDWFYPFRSDALICIALPWGFEVGIKKFQII
jgi:hypothetical protein